MLMVVVVVAQVVSCWGNRSFRPKSKSFRHNFKVVSFKVIYDVFAN